MTTLIKTRPVNTMFLKHGDETEVGGIIKCLREANQGMMKIC